MANATVQVPLLDLFGYVDANYPSTVFTPTTDGEYSVTRTMPGASAQYEKRMYCCLSDTFPENLKYQKLLGLHLTFQFYFKEENGTSSIRDLGSLTAWGCKEFNPRTLTYNTIPGSTGIYLTTWTSLIQNYTAEEWSDKESNNTVGGQKYLSYNAKKALQGRYFRLETTGGTYESLGKTFDKSVDNPEGTRYAAVKTRLTDGSMPYAIVTYDDEVTVPGKVEMTQELTGEVDNGIDQTVAWDIVAKAYAETDWFCLTDTYEAASGTLYWREQGETTWNSLASTADDHKSVTVPARTFDGGKTYEYYISTTDAGGGVAETDTATFTTPNSQLTAMSGPMGGYCNPREAITFLWQYSTTAGYVEGAATTLHWRETGDASWNDVGAAAGVYSITIAANTFSTLTSYEWYLEGEDAYGYESETDVYTFSTTAATVKTVPIAPANEVVDRNSAVTFSWSQTSNDGMQATRFILQYRALSDTTWTQLADITSPTAGNNSYEVAAGTISSGQKEWRALPYNIDDVAGTATVAAFISYGAPATPYVTHSGTPFLTVNWQSDDQQAYEIEVGGRTYGPYLGTEKTFTLPEYLEDGTYTVKVRTMGSYGLWSAYGTATAIIENDPGENVVITGTAGIDANLLCQTTDDEADFYIYRDGEQIAHIGGSESQEETNLLSQFSIAESKTASQNGGVAVTWNEDLSEAEIEGVSLYGRPTFSVYDPVGVEVPEIPEVLALSRTYTVKYSTTDAKIKLYIGTGSGESAYTGDTTITLQEGDELSMYMYAPEIAAGDTVDATVDISMPVNLMTAEFTDRMAAGEHTYHAINRLANGNYTISNTVTLTTDTSKSYAAMLSGGDWLELTYPIDGKKDPSYSLTEESFYNHLSGDTFPSAILSGYRDSEIDYGVLYLNSQETERAQFESMIGKAVIMKLRGGTVFTGILDNCKREHRKLHWTSYSFTLRRIEVEDYIDDTE